MEQKVKILVATYNNEKYIEELLDSLLSQSFSNIEIVIRDDGSCDSTLEIVNRIKESDSRIKILEIANSLKSAKSNFFTLLLNTPLEKNEYIMFADADDVWKKDKVEKTIEVMLTNETDLPTLVHTDLTVVDEQLNLIAPSLFKYEKISPERKTLKNILVQNNVTGCTVMINSALKDMVNEYPKDTVMHDWWLTLIAATFGNIVVLNEQTILYRQHGGNQIGAYDSNSLSQGFKKLSNKERMKGIYISMFRQAGCFSEVFKEQLKEEDKIMLDNYRDMEYLSKIKKIAMIIKGKYYKNTLLRNIGQFIVI